MGLADIQDDVWDDIPDQHFPDSPGYIAVLRAYVDASTRDDSGLLCVSAYLFESGRVRRFRQQWRDTFGSESFSWADLIARSKPFKHLRGPENNREHDRLVAAGVSLVREYTIAGSIASCWMQDVQNHAPTWIKGFGHAYSIAGHMAMAGLASCAKANGYRGGITYVIEAGDEGYDELGLLLSYAPRSDVVRDMYQWNGHSVVPKTPYSPFHAPDLLAWEWGKYWTETVVQKKRLMRRSLVKLLVDRLDSYRVLHLYRESLMRFFDRVHAIGVEQLQEDRDALASVQPESLAEQVQTSEQTTPVGDLE